MKSKQTTFISRINEIEIFLLRIELSIVIMWITIFKVKSYKTRWPKSDFHLVFVPFCLHLLFSRFSLSIKLRSSWSLDWGSARRYSYLRGCWLELDYERNDSHKRWLTHQLFLSLSFRDLIRTSSSWCMMEYFPTIHEDRSLFCFCSFKTYQLSILLRIRWRSQIISHFDKNRENNLIERVRNRLPCENDKSLSGDSE